MTPPDGPQCESLLVESDSIHHLSAWAARRNQPVTVFDLEATTFTPAVKWFGITEVALLHIYADGTASTRSALVNPERNIPKAVRELTGITNEAVRGQPTWEAWTSYMHDVAAAHVTVGYYSMGFDCPGVVRQNARYGHEGTEFVTHLDVASLPGVSGKLIDAAAERGIVSETYHRALADVWVTARLLESLAAEHGLGVLEEHIGRGPKRGGSGDSSSRDVRRTELLEHFTEHGSLPDLAAFGDRHDIKRSTAEGDVVRLIEEGVLPSAALERAVVQDWLAEHLEAAILREWHGEADGRLKPLMETLRPEAPEGLDYTQLRLALMKRG